VFMRVNSKCAHQVRPPLGRDKEELGRLARATRLTHRVARHSMAMSER